VKTFLLLFCHYPSPKWSLKLKMISMSFCTLWVGNASILLLAGLLNSFSSVDYHAFSDNSVDPSNEVDSHCSYGFFRHRGRYRWSATKVLLHTEIMWTLSIGHHGPLGVHGPPVEKPWARVISNSMSHPFIYKFETIFSSFCVCIKCWSCTVSL